MARGMKRSAPSSGFGTGFITATGVDISAVKKARQNAIAKAVRAGNVECVVPTDEATLIALETVLQEEMKRVGLWEMWPTYFINEGGKIKEYPRVLHRSMKGKREFLDKDERKRRQGEMEDAWAEEKKAAFASGDVNLYEKLINNPPKFVAPLKPGFGSFSFRLPGSVMLGEIDSDITAAGKQDQYISLKSDDLFTTGLFNSRLPDFTWMTGYILNPMYFHQKGLWPSHEWQMEIMKRANAIRAAQS